MIHGVMLATTALTLACTGAAAQSRKPVSSLVITNARSVPAADVTVRVGQGAVTLKRPLAPGAKATLKLPKMSGCPSPSLRSSRMRVSRRWKSSAPAERRRSASWTDRPEATRQAEGRVIWREARHA